MKRCDPIMRIAATVMFTAAGSGCVSRQYKLARTNTPPPRVLNLPGVVTPAGNSSAAPVDAVLNTVIIYGGPGSWKRAAYWDEYVVSLANRGDVPLVLETASLVDFQGVPSSPGDDPWRLEKASRSWWSRARASQTASLLALGAGTVVSAGAVYAAALGTIMSGGAAAGGAAGGAAAAAAAVTVVALPVYAVAIVAINHKNKKAVATEFDRRRLALPQTIGPGQVVQGSLFFRISPGPRQLVLRGAYGSERNNIVVDLGPLSALHMASKPR